MSGFVTETAPQASVAPPTRHDRAVDEEAIGLRGYDPERVFTGFRLFSPLPTTNKTSRALSL
jgi:hypothetical protein